LEFSGSGERTRFQVLLPEGVPGKSARVDGRLVSTAVKLEGDSRYAVVDLPTAARGEIRIE
jgi:hypothetical protein